MKKHNNSIDYLTVIKYLFIFILFTIFNKIEQQVFPYSTALLGVSFAFNYNLILTPILYLLSLVLLGANGLLAGGGISLAFLLIITLIYKSCKSKIKLEICIFTMISMLGYLFIGDTVVETDLTKRIFVILVCGLFSMFLYITAETITKKGLKYKLCYEEYASLTVTITLLGLGICNLISPYLWRTISVLVILFTSFLYRRGISTIISVVLSLALAIYYNDLNYVSIYLVWSVSIDAFISISRYLSAIAVVVSDYILQVVFSIYGYYTLSHFIFLLVGSIIFAVLPYKPLISLKERLYSFREKQLVRRTINRNRTMLSNRLFELSFVFNEMANAFTTFSKKAPDEKAVGKGIAKNTTCAVCLNCANYNKCKKVSEIYTLEMEKLVFIGLAKGKLSLIDLPKNIAENCVHPNDLLYALNKNLKDYRTYLLEMENLNTGRQLIGSQTEGVASMLKSLALDTGSLLKYQTRLERTLGDELFKHGFFVSELMIYGKENTETVSLILNMNNFSITGLQTIISKVVGKNMLLCDKNDISRDKCFLSFRKCADYDAVFGIAKCTKDNSLSSGDTYSVTRLDGDKFLVALSDGMGSGKNAETISTTSLTLIESFYKAGIESNIILNTVNKLLAINTEDSFSAMDISVIDLKNLRADFIKYGSPYGFIIGEEGIKIVEGNSLPLGILNELKPAICTDYLNDGDMLLFLSDGVSDAFKSSSEIIDFLRSVPALNPQTLADAVMQKALSITNGKKQDDMTALAVRVYKKNYAV
ncbi:MAG: SpoIIE family protein phosphatase [Clostridia bacterium]|nr:SpoIIE family protein phosphatase [Clostridia bacterium]